MRSFTRSAIVLAMVFMIQAASSALTGDRTSDKTWPRAVPCRIQDGANPDLFLMTLGDVETPLAQGTYDPRTDTVTLKDGTIRNNYFRDALGVKFFKPLDKSIFPLPPSGFCTWYYYYQDVNEDEVKRNADGSPRISKTTALNMSRSMTAGRERRRTVATARGTGRRSTRLFRGAWPPLPPTSSPSA